MRNRLSILEESLDKKLELLGQIQEYNALQEKSFSEGSADLEGFDEAVERKGELIEKLNRLDDGFEALYQGLSEELAKNRGQYAEQIRALQGKIAKVMELSVSIQAQEKRNKKLIEDYFAGQRAGIRKNRRSSKAAYDYYKSMSNSDMPRFYDNKN